VLPKQRAAQSDWQHSYAGNLASNSSGISRFE
jgi:hypothetical protein